ncbi:MAG: demethoxyubiquinone hydroxylase family protein [Betaproteobacteria bacterium]|nr:demethoxyubiquinone hydroxylase family protein [Betaproteobacteria bacterium]
MNAVSDAAASVSAGRAYSSPPAVPADLMTELRTDHAGETGAVWIYQGVLAITRDAALRDFAQRHLATEQEHLRLMCELVPPRQRSWLLGPWRVAGFITGALPALFGLRAVYGTIAAVETFVDKHYEDQIRALDGRPEHITLRDLLLTCQADECHHRDEAQALVLAAGGSITQKPGLLLRLWCAVVGWGSETAVKIARRI